MREAALFVEDFAHEAFISALVKRLATESMIEMKVRAVNVRGGRSAVVRELTRYVKDLESGLLPQPSLFVVATDANCSNPIERRKQVLQAVDKYAGSVVCAIPDPHIECWYLADSAAFKHVFGRGCAVPEHKCEKDFYKWLLSNSIHQTGITPLLGGLEYAEDLVKALDWRRAESKDRSLAAFLSDLRATLNQWKTST